jgi:hypothetical protein
VVLKVIQESASEMEEGVVAAAIIAAVLTDCHVHTTSAASGNI